MSHPPRLSHSDFLLSLTLAPRLVIELLVENHQGEVYLLKRNIPPFIDTWHIPGGFLLKGELISSCIHRLLDEELGLTQQSWEFVDMVEDINGDPRGHLLHYFVKVESDRLGISKNGKYFKMIPTNAMPHQIPMLINLGYESIT